MSEDHADTLGWTSDTVRKELGGIPVSTWKKMVQAGRVPAPVGRLGKRSIWRAAEIRAWFDAGMPGRAAWEERKKAAAFTASRKHGGAC